MSLLWGYGTYKSIEQLVLTTEGRRFSGAEGFIGASKGAHTVPSPVPLHAVTADVQSMKDARENPFNLPGHAARRQYLYEQVHWSLH